VTAVTGVGVMLAAAFLPVGKLADYSNSGTLFAFMMVAISVLVLRPSLPDARDRHCGTSGDPRLHRIVPDAAPHRDRRSASLGSGRVADLLRLFAFAKPCRPRDHRGPGARTGSAGFGRHSADARST